MYAHYASVWSQLDPNEFVIITMGVVSREQRAHGVPEFFQKIDRLGYDATPIEKVIDSQRKYSVAVSNHVLGGNTSMPESWIRSSYARFSAAYRLAVNLGRSLLGLAPKYAHVNPTLTQYPPLRVAHKQIRFMYGADISDAWSLQKWNNIYDLFLCHGPNDEAAIRSRFTGKTALMGYPRYDAYFTEKPDLSAEIEKFHIKQDRPTLLWMPTWDVLGDNLCSIRAFAHGLAEYRKNTNLIVRPHPISLREDKPSIALLESLGFVLDRDPSRDMSRMFRLADFVLCDHGGSSFGALYLGKCLILLRSDGYANSQMASGSSNLALEEYFPVLTPATIGDLGPMLGDEAFWTTKLKLSRALADNYFANYRGDSSRMAAQAIRDFQAKSKKGNA